MNIQQLLHYLKHGYTYTAVQENGESYPVISSPNKQMLAASRVIEQLLPELERLSHLAVRNSELAAEAFADCERLTKELNDAKKTLQERLGDSSDGDVKRNSNGVTN